MASLHTPSSSINKENVWIFRNPLGFSDLEDDLIVTFMMSEWAAIATYLGNRNCEEVMRRYHLLIQEHLRESSSSMEPFESSASTVSIQPSERSLLEYPPVLEHSSLNPGSSIECSEGNSCHPKTVETPSPSEDICESSSSTVSFEPLGQGTRQASESIASTVSVQPFRRKEEEEEETFSALSGEAIESANAARLL